MWSGWPCRYAIYSFCRFWLSGQKAKIVNVFLNIASYFYINTIMTSFRTHSIVKSMGEKETPWRHAIGFVWCWKIRAPRGPHVFKRCHMAERGHAWHMVERSHAFIKRVMFSLKGIHYIQLIGGFRKRQEANRVFLLWTRRWASVGALEQIGNF